MLFSRASKLIKVNDYRSYSINALFPLFLLWFGGRIVSANPDAKRLYDDLLSPYNRLARPVRNTTQLLTVRLRLKLSQIIDLVRDH
jgi:hypothetical protein